MTVERLLELAWGYGSSDVPSGNGIDELLDGLARRGHLAPEAALAWRSRIARHPPAPAQESHPALVARFADLRKGETDRVGVARVFYDAGLLTSADFERLNALGYDFEQPDDKPERPAPRISVPSIVHVPKDAPEPGVPDIVWVMVTNQTLAIFVRDAPAADPDEEEPFVLIDPTGTPAQLLDWVGPTLRFYGDVQPGPWTLRIGAAASVFKLPPE